MFMIIGFFIGFFAAVPIGPVNIYIISQTLKKDFFHGMTAGLMTALMDLTYCLVALVGFFHISINLANYSYWLKLAAGTILFLLGLKLFRDAKSFKLRIREKEAELIRTPKPLFGVIVLYISNPSLYAFWIAVAGAVTAHGLLREGFWPAVFFALSCGIGALVWYFFLVRVISHYQSRIQEKTLKKMLWALGVFLVGFSLFTFLAAFINP
jgi:threonine/homoserine/homoserine lactone efflux protein